ncbi:MAG: MATE family efflux transporter [Spirochaetes bacterium]|nr:MATE family efflux transporter [Spirochaetota bacterium]
MSLSLLKVEEKKIMKQLIRLALPLMLINFLQMAYNLTDAYFLGKLGREFLSAPSIAFNIIFFLTIFGMVFSMAGTTLIAQSKGKGDHEKVNFYLGQMTTFLLFIGILLIIIGLAATNFLLTILQTPADVFPYAQDYMIYILCGIPFMFGFILFQAALQGIGDTFTPLWIQIVSVGVNILLDPFLIFGWGPFPKLEVKGAAIATIISRAIASTISIYYLINGKKGIQLLLKNMIPNMTALKLLIKIGLPAAIGQSVTALGFTILQGVVNYFGSAVVAAFGICGNLIGIFNMPGMGISRATTTLVGQYLGARDINRAKSAIKVSIIMVLSFLIPSMTLTYFWGNYFVKFFVNDPETIRYGVDLFRLVSVSVVFFGMLTVILGAFQGAGDTKPAMILNISRLWVFRLPLAYVLAIVLKFGPEGIWWSMFFSNIVVTVAGFYWLKRGKWAYAIDVDKI